MADSVGRGFGLSLHHLNVSASKLEHELKAARKAAFTISIKCPTSSIAHVCTVVRNCNYFNSLVSY